MMEPRAAHRQRRDFIRWGALAVGVILFFATLYYINFRLAFGTIQRLGVGLPLALLFSGLWHLARTWAWAWCFPRPRQVSFLRLADEISLPALITIAAPLSVRVMQG